MTTKNPPDGWRVLPDTSYTGVWGIDFDISESVTIGRQSLWFKDTARKTSMITDFITIRAVGNPFPIVASGNTAPAYNLSANFIVDNAAAAGVVIALELDPNQTGLTNNAGSLYLSGSGNAEFGHPGVTNSWVRLTNQLGQSTPGFGAFFPTVRMRITKTYNGTPYNLWVDSVSIAEARPSFGVRMNNTSVPNATWTTLSCNNTTTNPGAASSAFVNLNTVGNEITLYDAGLWHMSATLQFTGIGSGVVCQGRILRDVIGTPHFPSTGISSIIGHTAVGGTDYSLTMAGCAPIGVTGINPVDGVPLILQAWHNNGSTLTVGALWSGHFMS